MQSSVCAICITADRPEMTMKVVDCFTSQSYPKKRLLVYDTSATCPEVYPTFDAANVLYFHAGARSLTVGALRNEAIEFAQMAACPGEFDIIAHFDSDDYSHPERIAEQVALLQSSGADIVGYREMLFWREPYLVHGAALNNPGEAWLYSNSDVKYALGTSLCYWRRAWEARPFADTSSGEDERFIRGRSVVGVSSLVDRHPMHTTAMTEPRMIARIHGSNTSGGYAAAAMEQEARRAVAPHWKRVAEWNSFCEKVMR